MAQKILRTPALNNVFRCQDLYIRYYFVVRVAYSRNPRMITTYFSFRSLRNSSSHSKQILNYRPSISLEAFTGNN